jgi:hypothetical protein
VYRQPRQRKTTYRLIGLHALLFTLQVVIATCNDNNVLQATGAQSHDIISDAAPKVFATKKCAPPAPTQGLGVQWAKPEGLAFILSTEVHLNGQAAQPGSDRFECFEAKSF